MDQHLDADRLAAFADGSLSRVERQAVEAHAADCPRCLHMLAAMVRTEERAVAQGRAAWRIPVVFRWSVPLLAAAAALALWINVREQSAIGVPPPAASIDASLPPQTSTPEVQPSKRPDDITAKPQQTEKREASASVQAKALGDQQSTRAEARPSAAETAPSAAPMSDRDLRQLPAPSPPPASPAPPIAAPVAAPNAGVAGAAPSDAAARFSAPQPVAETLATARSAAPTFEVISADPAVRWRVAGKTIVRSVDAGKTWTPERVPVQGEIVTGSSSSPLVAWFVGRGGYILLTTGTNQWRRVMFREPVDLSNVRAISEREAEVTTSDGRVFATNDGGQTWVRR